MLDPMETMAERFRRALEQAGVTQTDLAHACGVSKSAVGQWIHGDTKNIRPVHLFAAARRLGVDAEWLGTGEQTNNPGTTLDSMPAMSDVTRRIVDLMPAISEEAQQEVLEAALAIARRHVEEQQAEVERLMEVVRTQEAHRADAASPSPSHGETAPGIPNPKRPR